MWIISFWKWLTGRDRKGSEMSAKNKAVERLRLFSLGDFGQSLDQKTDRRPACKDQAEEVSAGKKDSIGHWTPDDLCYGLAESLSEFCSCPETLPKTEIKHGGLINLSRDISKQQTIGAVAWLLLAAFSQIYVENQEKRAKQDDLKCEFGQKGNTRRAVDCKDGAERISIAGKEPANRKDGLRASQEVAAVCALQPQNCKGERLCLEKKATETQVPEWRQRPNQVPKWRRHGEFVPRNQGQSVHQSRHSTPTSKREGSLATAPAGSRPWHHPRGIGFRCIQNARAVSLRRLPPRFQKKAWEARQCAPERAVCEAESEKPIQWKPQKFGKAKNVDRAKREQSQPKREAMGIITKSAVGAELHDAHNSVQTASDSPVGTMGFNVYPAGFWTCVGPNVLYYPVVCNFWNCNVYLMPLNVGYV